MSLLWLFGKLDEALASLCADTCNRTHLEQLILSAVAVQFLAGVPGESIPNMWWLTNNPDIANFETGALLCQMSS